MIAGLRTAAALAFLLFFIPFAAIVCIPWTLFSKNADFLYFFSLRGARFALWLAGVRVEVEGLEHLRPGQSYIFMSNHVSNVDPPVLIPVIPGRTSILIKRELFRVPILGPAMRLASLVPVERSDRESAIASIARASEIMKTGLHMTIFIEGTRSPDGKLLPFKKGPFHLAMETGAPVAPVTIRDTFPMMPRGGLRILGGTARVVFHPPLEPAKFRDREALMEAVRASIASSLPEEMR